MSDEKKQSRAQQASSTTTTMYDIHNRSDDDDEDDLDHSSSHRHQEDHHHHDDPDDDNASTSTSSSIDHDDDDEDEDEDEEDDEIRNRFGTRRAVILPSALRRALDARVSRQRALEHSHQHFFFQQNSARFSRSRPDDDRHSSSLLAEADRVVHALLPRESDVSMAINIATSPMPSLPASRRASVRTSAAAAVSSSIRRPMSGGDAPLGFAHSARVVAASPSLTATWRGEALHREFDDGDSAAASDGDAPALDSSALPQSSPFVDRATPLRQPVVRRMHRGSPGASPVHSPQHSDDASRSIDDEHDSSTTQWSDARSELVQPVRNFDAYERRPVDTLSVAAQELEYQLRGIGGTVRQFDEQVAQQRMARAREEEQQVHHAVGVQEESVEARTRRAVLYVRGALDGRHIVHGTGRLFEWAFFFQTHPYVRLIPMICNMAHVLFAFWEPPNPAASLDFELYPTERQRVMVGIELGFCLVYGLFLATRIRYLGWRHFLRRWYNVVYLGSALLMAIDACITLGHGPGLLRFSRAIRPLLVIANSARLRSLATAMVNTIPAVVDVFGIMMLVIVVYATVALQLFGGLYVDANSGELLADNFDSFPSALISLVVLTSSENYPGVMYPAMRSSEWSVVYFVTFILLETFLLMSVLIAVSFNRFLEQNRLQVLARRALQRRGLLAAFAALDITNSSDISFDDIFRLLRELRGSEVDRDEARAVFAALDQDNSGTVDVLEFFRIADVLLLGFYRLPRRQAHHAAVTRFDRFRAALLQVVQSRWFNVLSALLIVLSFIDICLSVAYIDDARLVGIFDIIDGIITGLFLLEVIMRMVALGVRAFFRDGWLIFDLFVVLVSLVFPIANALEEFVGVGSSSLVLRVFRLGRLIKAMRLIGVSMHFRVITMTYVYLWPMMWRLFALLSAVMVAYGIVGMELFGGTDMRLYSDGYVTFDTPFAAMLTVFQLFTTSNWHQVMYAAMEATTAWASIYFLSFYFLVIKFILYLLLALIIESFSMAMESFDSSRALAHAKAASAAKSAASGSPHASPGVGREWVAKRKRQFSLSEMFNTTEHEGALDPALAADAGIEAERMERYLERANTQKTVASQQQP